MIIDNFTNSLRTVLAAEDDEGDATLLRLAFKRAGISHPLIVVPDGQEAIDYLSGNPPYLDRAIFPVPGLALLDVKMPRLNGFDVLAWRAERLDLRDLPVVILSSSCHASDMARALRMGAREYIVKPHGFMELSNMMRELCGRYMPGVLAPG